MISFRCLGFLSRWEIYREFFQENTQRFVFVLRKNTPTPSEEALLRVQSYELGYFDYSEKKKNSSEPKVPLCKQRRTVTTVSCFLVDGE